MARARSDGPDPTTDAASYAESVAASRAGDRFHYVWAAVQSLKLLDQRSGLREVWIEGAAGEPVAGDEVIDLAEYFGAEPDAVDRAVVRQLKYSTRRAGHSLGLSELGDTFRKFARVDARRHTALHVPSGASVEYVITSNRPIGVQLQRAVTRILNGQAITPESNAAGLLRWLELDQPDAAELLQRIRFDGQGAELAALRARLDTLTAELTGAADPGIPAVLVEQVSRRASGESRAPIDLATLAMAFGVMAEELVPAPSLIPAPPTMIGRTAYRDLADAILPTTTPVIVSAVGGAGKTTFAVSLPALLADRAVVIIYDCFGNGTYRAPDKPRHRHRDGLVQIASELAAHGLCSPLIPRPGTAAAELTKAFVRRLVEAHARLAEASPGRQLVVVIDAADNAALVADARSEATFVRDLLRLDPIEGVHIILTARPYRIELLDPPVGLEPVELPEFAPEESAAMLRAKYPSASDPEAAEFHRRTSANPRIQAIALSDTTSLRDCLDDLTGLTPDGADPVDQLLGRQLDRILENAGTERDALNFAGQLLATLRPRIPIDVLAALTGRPATLIRSYVSDLGRGLLIDDDAVQFLDEPTETFFRSRYQLRTGNADRVIEELTTLARSNAYTAASLPQVLWEADRFDALTALALSDESLPNSGEVERRQIAQLRIVFALRAAIRVGDPAGVVQLAMIAGSTAASSARRYTLLRDHPDLAGEVLDRSTLDEIRAARLFPSDWPGSALAAEAVMLAVQPRSAADAASRLRASHAAVHAYVNTPREDRAARLEPRQVADVALATTLLRGEGAAAAYLQGWQPEAWVLDQTRPLIQVLLSRNELARVARLGLLSRTPAFTLGIAAEMERLGVAIAPVHAERAWTTLRGPRVDIEHDEYSPRGTSDAVYRGVAWVTAAAVRLGHATPRQGVNLLTKYLPAQPPRRLGDYHGRDNAGLLCAYALRAALRSREVTVEELEPSSDGHRSRFDSDNERAQLTLLLPWLQEWATWALGRATAASTREILGTYPTSRASYRDPMLLRRVAGPMAAQFARSSRSSRIAQQFSAILRSAQRHSGLYVATDMIGSLLGDERFVDAAYACAGASAESAEAEHQNADQMAEDLVRVARTVYAFDPAEAHAYFERAIGIVSRVGDDAWQRWDAVAAVARVTVVDDPEEAYRLAAHFAHTAERLDPYMYNGFNVPQLANALQRVAGPRALALISQWRDRRFEQLGHLLASLCSEPAGLLTDAPDLIISLSAFSDHIPVGPLVSQLAAAGELTDAQFAATRDLVRASGEDLYADDVDPAIAQRFGLRRREVTPSESSARSSSFADPEYEKRQQAALAALREQLRSTDLASADGMTAVAEAFHHHHGSDASLLIDEIAARPRNTWARIISAVASTEDFGMWQRADFIAQSTRLESSSQAVRASLQALAEDYLIRYATELTSGHSLGLDLSSLASVLGSSVPVVLRRALELTDAEVAVASPESCYRLASRIALLLAPEAAMASLKSALADLEVALEVPPWSATGLPIPDTSDLPTAVAAMIWSAMADPRAAIRWQASHAARFLIAFGHPEAVAALARFAVAAEIPGYVDERFPFYQLHAVEGFLVATERAALSDPTTVAPLLAAVTELGVRYPDHVRIQRVCQEIGRRSGDRALTSASTIPRRTSDDLPRFERPSSPKPFGHHAAHSEFSFHFDLEEYWIGALSESFRIEHQEVLTAMSDLILHEWGYRGSAELETDPRREAGAYAHEETYFYKYDFPKAEDLDYYLTYHALLTVAGRVLRTATPFRDPEDGAEAFDEWFRQFDLTRQDRLWLADARRPVPAGYERHEHSYDGEWVWRVTTDDFPPVFLGEDGWITVRLAAQQSASRTWDNVFVSTALVASETAPALMRALQTGPSFNSHRLPLAGDDDFTFDAGAFQLRGWIDSADVDKGADSRDEFARDIHHPTPRPSMWVRDLMGLEPTPDGLSWTRSGDTGPVAVSDAWAENGTAREASGPDGQRLRVSPTLLTSLATATGMAVILEVRFDRHDGSARRDRGSDETMGYLDDYVKFFLYTPADGWRDAGGRPSTR